MEREAWITGIGLVSSLGEGVEAHWRALAESDPPRPVVDRTRMPPFAFHPLVSLDLDRQIPRRSDQRQMEPWQRLGTYAAGLALDDAGIAGDEAILARTHALIAADGGERDEAADTAILDYLATSDAPGASLNQRLASDLRPTLFLAQLPNLLAGNISIVHKVTGSSRTFMGEEIAGVGAVETAWRRIAGGQGDVFLVGGAIRADRKDTILHYAVGGLLWSAEPVPVWARADAGGGLILGSVGAFLVIEAREHAEARGRQPYARVANVVSDFTRRRRGDVARALAGQFDRVAPTGVGPVAVLSGATGIARPTREELEVLTGLAAAGRVDGVRGAATMLGAAVNATFPALSALAAIALSRRGFYKPFDTRGIEQPVVAAPERIVITSVGFWRGEGMGLIARPG